MIGMRLFHPQSGNVGTIDAVSVDPTGRSLCRVDDHWFFVDECIATA